MKPDTYREHLNDLQVEIEELRAQLTVQPKPPENGFIPAENAEKKSNRTTGDTISRQAALDAIEEVDWYHQNKNKDMVFGANSSEHQAWYKADDIYKTLEELPSVHPVAKDINVLTNDCISRQAAIDALNVRVMIGRGNGKSVAFKIANDYADIVKKRIEALPSAQPTLHGYNIDHLALIARVLQKENLPPERVVEALTDIGRIVAIVRDEFEETLRRAVQNIERRTDD